MGLLKDCELCKKKVRADAINELVNVLKNELNPYTGNSGLNFNYDKMCEFLDEYTKEKGNERN